MKSNFYIKYSCNYIHGMVFICMIFCSFQVSMAQENCTNGIDDDNDGLIDLNDVMDCDCAGLGVTPSLLSNSSFESYNYIPNWVSQMDACTGWMQATVDGTSDYFYSPNYDWPEVTNLGLAPPPDGNGYVGGIITFNGGTEDIGACLSSSLVAGTNYQITFSIASFPAHPGGGCNGLVIGPTNIDIVIYGNASCLQMPVATSDCPTSADPTWVELGSVNYVPTTSWSNITISFTPVANINAIILGGPCMANIPASFNAAYGYDTVSFSVYCTPYFLFDNLILNEAALFMLVSIDSEGAYCSKDLLLKSNCTAPGGVWQWYKDGIALVGQTSSTIFPNAFGTGTYTITYTLNGDCGSAEIIVLNDFPNAEFVYNPTEVDMDHSEVLFFNLSTGAIDYIWQIDEVSFSNSVNPSHIFTDTGLYCITLIATNAVGCSDSTTTCIEVQASPPYALYIPNAFTVNADGLNEIFQVKGIGVKSLQAKIFNLWGEEIFSFYSIDKGWNGVQQNNQIYPQGVYTYMINTTDFKNKEYTYFGKILLLR